MLPPQQQPQHSYVLCRLGSVCLGEMQSVLCSAVQSVLLCAVVPFSGAVPNDASLFRPFCTSLLAPVGCGAVSLALRTVTLLLLGGACSATFSFAVEGLRFSFPIADRSLFSCCSRWNVRHFCRRIVAGLVVQPLPVFASPATPTFSVGGFFTGRFAKAEYLEAVSQPPSAPKLTEKGISLQPFGVARSACLAHCRTFKHGSE